MSHVDPNQPVAKEWSQTYQNESHRLIRLLAVAVIGLVLFFPAYWAYHPILGPDAGAVAALVTGFLIIPSILLRVWKVYPEPFGTPVEPDDPIMLKAIDRSMSEFERFKQGLQESRKEAYVKYPIQTGEDCTEHVWGLAHSLRDDGIVVSLVNEPIEQISDDEELQPRAVVPIEQIEDWMLVDRDGQCEGGYTHLALAKIYKRIYGKFPKKYRKKVDVFVDIDWSELDQPGN